MKKIIFIFIILLAIVFAFFFIGQPPEANEIIWGVNFSQKQAGDLGLDWREVYSAILDDLKVKNIKLLTHWDLIEPEEGKYDFSDLDWQILEAEKRDAEILLVIGMKTGRWPECHEPDWLKIRNPKSEIRKSYLLNYIEKIINRYKDSGAIWAWQVENEPLFPFGECPQPDKEFLKKEIALVKSLDNKARPVVISDSGEWSFWVEAAKLGDIVAATMYRRVWFNELKSYVSYPLPPVFYWRKAQIIKNVFDKEVMVGELQAEPWLAGPEKTMDLKQFKNNVRFAQETGLKEFYFWGAEWWYWLKQKQNQPEIWLEAKKWIHFTI